MSNLQKDVQYIKGVGPSRVKMLNNLGIFTLEDLITYYPRTHEDRSKPKMISEIGIDEEVLIEAKIMTNMSEISTGRGLKIYKLVVADDSASCTITWYNQKYLKNMFKIGDTYKFYGKMTYKSGKREMQSPVFDRYGESKNTGKIIPIYNLTYGLAQNTLRRIIEMALKERNK